MRNECVANCAPTATLRAMPVANVKVGSFTTVCDGPGVTKNRWTKLNCTTPGSTTQVPPRLAERYSRDWASSGAAATRVSRANHTCLVTGPPWSERCALQFRIPHSAFRTLSYRHSCPHLSYSTGVTFPCVSTSIPDGSRYAFR